MEGTGGRGVTSSLRPGIIAAVATLLIDQASKLWLLYVFDLGHRVLELTSLLDQGADLLRPFLGDMFDVPFTIRHERQRPGGVSLSIGAPAVGFAAAVVRLGERAG